MKNSIFYTLLITMVCFLTACSEQGGEHAADEHSSHGEKPIQHLKLEDITSGVEAATVFTKQVAFITGKDELTAATLNEIHMSTYSLEKAVAYYAENSEGAKKALVEKIAVVVEEIHLASENNRAEDTQKYVEQLTTLVQEFKV